MTDPKKDKQENQPEKESTPFAFESEEGPAEQETVAKALAERQMEAIEEIDDSAFELEEDGEVPAPLDGEKAADSSDPAAVAGASQPESAPPEEPLQPRMEEEPFTGRAPPRKMGKPQKTARKPLRPKRPCFSTMARRRRSSRPSCSSPMSPFARGTSQFFSGASKT